MLPCIICRDIILYVTTMFCYHLPCPLSRNSFPYHNRIPVLLLILCHDRVVKCCDNILIVILYFALSLLRHSSACCDKLLQVALRFCRDNYVITSRHNFISCLSHFFLLFLRLFLYFMLIFSKFLQNTILGEDSII